MQMKVLSQRLPMIDLMNKSRNASDFGGDGGSDGEKNRGRSLKIALLRVTKQFFERSVNKKVGKVSRFSTGKKTQHSGVV
jgi:hypothetical protein